MRTVNTKGASIERKWQVIDATNRPLGRLASEVAGLLRGKHKPIFTPSLDTGDFVIVINAANVKVTGGKAEKEEYFRNSGYPGGGTFVLMRDMLAKQPTRVIEHAVKGMLPHNSLGRAMFRKLKVYPGADHPHQSQVAGTEGAK